MAGRIHREKQTIERMIHLYCTDHHDTQGELCDSCQQLLTYAKRRLDSCPFQDQKPACNHCQTHCYTPAKQQAMREIMRYSGPKMMVRHPWLSLRHLIDTFRKVPSLEKPSK